MATRETNQPIPARDLTEGITGALSPITRRPWLLAVLLVALTFGAYEPVRRAGFIWDDDDHLTANPAMTAPHGLQMIWSSLAVSRYYPLTLTSFWIQRRLWGLNPMPYHLVNVALHAINGILLYLVLRRLRIPAAWLAAMLWVLHPVNVESVAWITELKNTQSGVFFFLALLCFLRFEAQPNRRWYALAVLCGLAALLSKPSTVVLPLVLLLCAWWQRGRWRWADMVRTAPFFGLALGMSALTIVEQRRHVLGEGTQEWNLGLAERLVIAGKAVWFYASKLVWPAQLAFVYPRWEVDVGSFWSWIPLAGLVAAGILLWVRRRESWARATLFGCGCFVAALLPVLGFFDVYYFRYSYVADHFQYLAGVALIVLVASAGTRLCARAGQPGKIVATTAVPLFVLVLGALTWKQAGVYRDTETLWRDTLTKNPDCWMGHDNLGLLLQESNRLSEAIGHYEQALRINPDDTVSHNNLGNAWLQAGRVEDAIHQYEEALRTNPGSAEAHYDLGRALQQTGKLDQAIGQYEQALRSKPGFAEAHNNLGDVLRQTGKSQEAVGHFEQALQLKPEFAEARYNMGLVLSQLGNTQEAIGQYEQALRIKPDYAAAHNNLGSILLQMGRIQDAIGHFEQALRSNPDSATAHNNLGNALLQAGRLEDAIRHYQQALRSNPGSAAGHYNLGNALLRAGRPKEAIGQYEEAVRLDPGLTPARDILTRLRASQ